MEIEKNVLTDDDSDTDYDCDDDDTSSDDDDNFTREFGNIKTKTSCQGKVQIKLNKEEDDEEKEDEEMDDFEAEMEKELAQRVIEAETKAAIANTHSISHQEDIEIDEDGNEVPMPSTSQDKSKEASDKYSDIYFDSDDDDDGDQRKKIVSNDELFYDPDQDAEDQTWVDSVRQSYQMSRPGDSVKKLPNSDAVLNCPACFSGEHKYFSDRFFINISTIFSYFSIMFGLSETWVVQDSVQSDVRDELFSQHFNQDEVSGEDEEEEQEEPEDRQWWWWLLSSSSLWHLQDWGGHVW